MFFLHKKHLPQRNLYTQTAHRSFYRPTFWHAETLPRAVFTQQKLFRTEAFTHKNKYAQQFSQTDGFYTQKVLRTEVLRTEGFTHSIFYIQTLLHTDVFTQTQIAHRNLCTQHAFTHNQLLRREALLPLLDHLPFVFPPLKSSWSMNVDVG